MRVSLQIRDNDRLARRLPSNAHPMNDGDDENAKTTNDRFESTPMRPVSKCPEPVSRRLENTRPLSERDPRTRKGAATTSGQVEGHHTEIASERGAACEGEASPKGEHGRREIEQARQHGLPEV